MEIIDPTMRSDWDETISSIPEYTFFHSSNWARVLRDYYSYKPLYCISREGSKIAALIPLMEVRSPFTGNRGVSIPFTDRLEPIATDANCFTSVFDEILRYAKKAEWRYLELRGGACRMNGAVPYRTYVRHVLDITDQEKALRDGLKPSTRRNIQKAQKLGVQVVVSNRERDLETYYQLHCMTRQRQGVPPQPLGFFRAIQSNVISKGKGFTVLATYQGRPISGAVYFHFGKKAIYKYGATDMTYQHLRAANLVMWEAIMWFSRNGFDELCFGRTKIEHTGLIRFKAGWGAREETLNYYRYDLRRSGFVAGTQEMSELGESILRRLPVPLLRFVGNVLYKHMG